MPELPEIVNLSRKLTEQLKDKVITGVAVRTPQFIKRPSVEAFQQVVVGLEVRAVTWRGKYLKVCMKGGACIVFHLMLTGWLSTEPSNKYAHLTFSFEDGTKLYYTDYRRFGKIWFIRPMEIDMYSGMWKLGPDAIGDDRLRRDSFIEFAHQNHEMAKEFLMAQDNIAGIGHRYSDEILFEAHINPTRYMYTLTDEEAGAIFDAIPKVLNYHIELDIPESNEYCKIHGHTVCPVCGSRLEDRKYGSTRYVYCANCQH